MATINPGAWNGQDQSMSSAGDDDFQHFFDIGMSNMADSIHFDFHNFNSHHGVHHGAPMIQNDHRDMIDTPMSDVNVSSAVVHSNMRAHSQISPMMSASSHATGPAQILSLHHVPNDTISEIDAQIQFLQHQRLQQQQRHLEEQQRQLQEQQAAFYAHQQRQQNLVPPTPQSLEMQAARQFYTSQDRQPSGMFEEYQQMKEQQDMSFTPLVSPAVTPLDAHFPVDHHFMVPNAYFSPISSPALHAQPDSTLFYDSMRSGHTSQTTNSPVAMEVESNLALPTTGNVSNKESRKSNTLRRQPKIRQSPITKPQRKKTTLTPVMNAQALSELAEAVAEGSEVTPKSKSVSAYSNEESENASVSPEALDMPPPPLPLPRSARQSPYIAPQSNSKPAPSLLIMSQNGQPSPATPASLFRISPRNQTTDPCQGDPHAPEHIENFELPESISSISTSEPQEPPSKARTLSRLSLEEETLKTNTLPPLTSPLAPKPGRHTSTSHSPQITTRSSTPAFKKTPLLVPKGAKKRGSISSLSPALLPKISPSIKPLLPGTPRLSSEDSASILLASKSNYQRILEGNTMPGVTYPTELSTNLTSKRTSHKIAEQGRRNRINSALQEIAVLLPKGTVKEGSEGDGDNASGDKTDGKQSNTQNSKASTVESAIEYIKHLQKELAEANKRAEEAEKKLQESRTGCDEPTK